MCGGLRARVLGIPVWFFAIVWLLAFLPAARAQYVLEDAHDPKRYEPGFTGIPFGFYSDSFGPAAGVAGNSTGLLQPQSDIFFFGLGTGNGTYGMQVGMDDLQLLPIDRLFVDWEAAYFHFTRDEVFLLNNRHFPNQTPGTNRSSKHDHLNSVVNDTWGNVNFKFLLPFGDGKTKVIEHYTLEDGLPVDGPDGWGGWNPFTTGRTFIEAMPFSDYQTVRSLEVIRHHYDTNGLRVGLVYDNSDYPLSPDAGNITRLSLSRDFGLFRSSNPWTNVSAEFTQYVPLGCTTLFRQQVLALDAWTSYSPTAEETGAPGHTRVRYAPPYFEGPELGGETRLRAYTDGRFHDRAASYFSAELRLIPTWNPLRQISFFKKADIAWWQWVVFGELGRVGDAYTYDELLTHMKGDAGFGIRVMSQDTVFRIDVAAGHEGYSVWANLGQTF